MRHIIVDDLYLSEEPLVRRTPLMNLVSASGQSGYALAYAKELGLGDGPWLLVSPVYFHTTHNDVLMINDCSNVDLTSYFLAFSEFVAQDGWQVHSITPNLWLVSPTIPVFSSAPLFDIAHQSVKPFLDTWPKAWLQWFTEIQMLFQTLPSNTCNAVWVWGQGDYQPVELGQNYLMRSKDEVSTLSSTSPIHFWWQDCNYIQSPPSLLQRIKKWWQNGH
jgi:hypothetical protein